MAALAQICRAYPADVTLECAVPCKDDLDIEMGRLAALVRDAGLALDGLVVSPSVDRQSTPPGSRWPDCPPLADLYAAARRALPRPRLGGGMLSYFTELNRKRVPADRLDFVTHCTNPIVHAADDLSVMQSLEALSAITRSVRAIQGGKPYRIGPSTIAMRQNPYGSATKDNPHLVRMPMANRDARHNALFAAAWAVGYASRVAPAGLEQLVLSAFAGPFGLIADAGEPVRRGGLRPLFHVIGALAGLAGMPSIEPTGGDDSRLAILAARKADGAVSALLANLTPEPLEVDVSAMIAPGQASAILDAASLNDGWHPASPDQGHLQLPPYAVARLG
jgi:hypothetical protein